MTEDCTGQAPDVADMDEARTIIKILTAQRNALLDRVQSLHRENVALKALNTVVSMTLAEAFDETPRSERRPVVIPAHAAIEITDAARDRSAKMMGR